MAVNFPVFILAKDSGEISCFDSIEAMQRELEQIDVENDEYLAWDQTGASLRLSVQKPVWLEIEGQISKSNRSSLRDALNQYAAAVGANVKIEGTREADFANAFALIKSHVGRQTSSIGFLRRIIGRNK